MAGMDTPTLDDVLDSIDKTLHLDFRSNGFAIQGLRESKNVLWFRTPDSDGVFKITVEELPREDWPPLPL